MDVVRCVLSGSYRRDFEGLTRDYRELVINGCQVLSPHRLTLIDPSQEFVKDEAEADLPAYDIEKHHLLALKQSDFMWLYCPGGYVGLSAAMEIGYALAQNIPVFCKTPPREEVFQNVVCVVPSVFAAIERVSGDA